MKKIKLITVVGTRPEIIRLSCVISRLESLDAFDHCLVHTGQNYDYELNEIFFKDLQLPKPKFFLNSAGSSAMETIGSVIQNFDKVLEEIKPDAVLVLGDTNSCLSILAAKRRKIPTFHMEAGNRCFDQRVPEEINRKIVDHIADINLTYSSIAREYLINEGLPPDRVIRTGSPMFEVLKRNEIMIDESSILEDLKLDTDQYFLVSSHREENIINPQMLKKLLDILITLTELYEIPVIFSTHPRTKKQIQDMNFSLPSAVKLLKPFGFFDYCNLQINARAVLSDSGTINEESSILNFPAVNIRQSHERLEGMEEAAVMMTGFNIERVIQAIEILRLQKRGHDRTLSIVEDYNIQNVSEKIPRIILSYIDSINQNIWKKPV